MKKVLIATTALVLSGGIAAAEVTLSGDGRMGVIYDGDDAQFESRARVKFNLSGNTDAGLEFGGSFRVDHEDEDGASASKGGAGSVYVKGAYGKLTFGDVDSAAENAVGDLHGVGLTGLGDYNEMTYIASDGEENKNPGALYEYSNGPFAVYASMLDGSDDLDTNDADDDKQYSIGAKYTADMFSVGLGYESTEVGYADRVDHIIVGATGMFGDAEVKAIYGKADDIDFTQYGLSGKYAMGATEVTAFWVRQEVKGNDDVDSFGIGASYDLGGGASLKGGIVDTDKDYNKDGKGGDTIADFGISFKF